MAIRLGLGRAFGRSKPRFKMPKWGVRGSLFAAFALIAGMGLVIAAGAGFVFNHLGATMMDLSGRDIPRLSASLQLASQSATLAAQGPGLLASPLLQPASPITAAPMQATSIARWIVRILFTRDSFKDLDIRRSSNPLGCTSRASLVLRAHGHPSLLRQ